MPILASWHAMGEKACRCIYRASWGWHIRLCRRRCSVDTGINKPASQGLWFGYFLLFLHREYTVEKVEKPSEGFCVVQMMLPFRQVRPVRPVRQVMVDQLGLAGADQIDKMSIHNQIRSIR